MGDIFNHAAITYSPCVTAVFQTDYTAYYKEGSLTNSMIFKKGDVIMGNNIRNGLNKYVRTTPDKDCPNEVQGIPYIDIPANNSSIVKFKKTLITGMQHQTSAVASLTQGADVVEEVVVEKTKTNYTGWIIGGVAVVIAIYFFTK